MEHRYFDTEKYVPINDMKIWRYMSLTSFLSFLETSSLYFAPLSSFTDPYEGTLPEFNYNNFWPEAQENYKKTKLLREDYVKSYTASCWHESTHESEALWRLYSYQGPCVAIQSTYRKIMKQMPENVVGVKIRYLDFTAEGVGETVSVDGKEQFQSSFLEYASIKRKSFEHEKEVRFLIPKRKLKLPTYQVPPETVVIGLDGDIIATGAKPDSLQQKVNEYLQELTKDAPFQHDGDNIKIDLENTLERILVSPFMNDWEATSIANTIARYKLATPIEQSKLLRPHEFI